MALPQYEEENTGRVFRSRTAKMLERDDIRRANMKKDQSLERDDLGDVLQAQARHE